MSLKKIKQLFNIEKGVLQSSKCIEGEYDFITAAADWKTHNEYTHDCEALIFAAAASGSLGRTHYVNGKFISSDLCFILTPKEPEKLPVNLRFYHIIFNLYKNEIVAATKAGTSKEAIGLRVFGEYELPYFDISIQQKVKAEFGKAEALKNDLFDEYTYQLTLLENLNQAILQEAVQGKLVPQDPKDEPASELLKRIKAEKATLRQAQGKGKKEKPLPPIKPDEIPFEIPENWVWCRLIDVGTTQTGTTPPTANKEFFGKDIPFIKPADISLSGINYENEGLTLAGLEKGVLIKENSLMMVCIGGSTGKSNYTNRDVSCNQQINAIKGLCGVSGQFLQYFLQSPYFQKAIWAKSSGGTTPIVNKSKWESIPIPLPPLSEQKRIVAEIEKQFAKTKQLKEHIIANQQATEQLLKALLHQAFEVKEVETV
jgi:type I restriction enzyme S subunit